MGDRLTGGLAQWRVLLVRKKCLTLQRGLLVRRVVNPPLRQAAGTLAVI